MVDAMVGKWKLDSYENFETFLEAMGVPEAAIKLITERDVELSIVRDGEHWKMTTISGEKERVTVFPVGQEVESITMMGLPVKATLTIEGDEMVETQQTPVIGELIIRKTMVDGKLKNTMTAKGSSAGLYFVRV